MAIKIGGIDNPTAVKFVNGGVTTNLSEVWYKSSPSATAVKVWPDTPTPTGDIYYYSFPKEFFKTTSWIFTVGLNTDGSDGLYLGRNDGKYDEVGYPITDSSTWTVNFDGGGVKTYASKTTTHTVTNRSTFSSFSLKRKSGSNYLTFPDKDGYYCNIYSSQLPFTFRAPTNGYNRSAYPNSTSAPYYFVPNYTHSTDSSTGSVTLPSSETVGTKKLTGWKNSSGTVYSPGASYTPTSDGITLTAVWENAPTGPQVVFDGTDVSQHNLHSIKIMRGTSTVYTSGIPCCGVVKTFDAKTNDKVYLTYSSSYAEDEVLIGTVSSSGMTVTFADNAKAGYSNYHYLYYKVS